MSLFSGPKLKLKRARRHILGLRELLDTHLTEGAIIYNDFTIEPQPPDDMISATVSGTTTFRELPEDVPAILGDIVHNLRSALDLMASELAAQRGGNPDQVYFPFAWGPGGIKEQIKRKHFHKCGKDAVDLLKSFEPWTGGNIELRAIHDLDIIDKHRGLIPQPTGSGILFDIKLVDQPDGSTQAQIVQPDPSTSYLTFPPEAGLGDRELFATLEELVNLTEGIIEAFAALEPSSESGSDSVPNGSR